MGIHYDYKSTRGAKAMEKQAKREKKLAERKAKRQAKEGIKKESEVKDNKNMERKTDFISEEQNIRITYEPDLVSLIEKTITGHTRAGIKTDSKTDWESNDPIFRGVTNNRAMIDYRTSKGSFYKQGQNIEGTDMIIESFSRESVIIKYPTGLRVFYVESYQEFKK